MVMIFDMRMGERKGTLMTGHTPLGFRSPPVTERLRSEIDQIVFLAYGQSLRA